MTLPMYRLSNQGLRLDRAGTARAGLATRLGCAQSAEIDRAIATSRTNSQIVLAMRCILTAAFWLVHRQRARRRHVSCAKRISR